MAPNAAALWINDVFLNFDIAVTTFIHNLFYPNNAFFTPFFEFISFLAYDGIPLIILSFVFMIFKKTRRFGAAMLFGLAIGAIITNCCLKIIVARPRPYTDTSSIFYQFWQQVGMNTESDKSFPSGHTTAAFAAATAVYLVGNRKYSWTAYIFGILMGIARIYLCVHFPSDVVAGILCGIIGGVIGTLIASKLPYKFYGCDFYPLSFKTPDKLVVTDEDHVNDYKSSQSIGRCTFGNLGFYWRDLGKKYFCEYPYITKAFLRVSECSEDEFSQNYNYFRLILEHDGKEFANLIINKEKDANDALNALNAKLGIS